LRMKKSLSIMVLMVLFLGLVSTFQLAFAAVSPTQLKIGNLYWYQFKGSTTNKGVIVMFGGYTYSGSGTVWLNDFFSGSEYTVAKQNFVDALVANSYDVLVPNCTSGSWSYSGSQTFVYDAMIWMKGHGYTFVCMFGFSAGSVIAGYEIQKSYGGNFSATMLASAPVYWSGHPGIFQSATTANKAVSPVSFIAPIDDGTYSQMGVYYTNMVISKEWNDWTDGHEPFANLSTLGEPLSDAAVNWFAVTTISVTVKATDPNDWFQRYWGLTFDRAMPPEQGGNGYVGADANEKHYSGDTMTAQKTVCSSYHYLIFIVSQTGGPNYGTYSGTITINNHNYTFSGVDAAHSARIDYVVTKVVIYATDPNDWYQRYWGLTFDRPVPPEQGGNGYVGADANEKHYRGDTMVFSTTLPPGAHYLCFQVSQTGGPGYGTYSGTIRVNGRPFSFSGVDSTHQARIDFTATKVVIYATDPNDGFQRYWGLTFDRAMPPEQGGNGYVGADANEKHHSGDTMTVLKTLSAGPHYLIFIVSQTGGPGYGTYSGTITINGHTYSFSGVDAAHSARIDFYA